MIPNHQHCIVFPEDIGRVSDFDGKNLTICYTADGWNQYLNLKIYSPKKETK